MDACSKLLCICTCGLYPFIWNKMLAKIDLKSMTLKVQIILGVMLTLLLVQAILLGVLIVSPIQRSIQFNLKLFFSSTQLRLNAIMLDQHSINLIQNINDAADQSVSVFQFTQWTLQKDNAVLQQIMSPTYFDEYPLDWSVVSANKFSNLTPDPTNPQLSYDGITYSRNGALTTPLTTYAQQMTVFDQLWQRQIKLYLGPMQNTNAIRLFSIYQYDNCEAILMTYPGQDYTWTSSYNLGTRTCQDLDKEFGNMWTDTVSLGLNQFDTGFDLIDPFNNKFNCPVICVTTPTFDSQNNTVGVFGFQFNSSDFFSDTISNMIVNNTALLFWVYNLDDVTSAIYSNVNSSLPALTASQVSFFKSNPVQSPPLDSNYFTQITYNNQDYYGVSANIVPYKISEFLLIFLQEAAPIASFMDKQDTDTQNFQWQLILIICGASILLFMLISTIVFYFTKRISEPITKLTDLTTLLKQATDIDGKKEVIKKVKEDPMFAAIRDSCEKKRVDNESREPLLDIQEQETYQDEVEELKKIFYVFFVEVDESQKRSTFNMQPKYYAKNHAQEISLDELEFADNNFSINDIDHFQFDSNASLEDYHEIASNFSAKKRR